MILRTRILLILFFLMLVRLSAMAQDPDCHIEVISGSPAWFYFNSADDYVNGKTLYYNTVVKIHYTKRPKSFDLYIRATGDVFDGSSTLSTSCIQVRAESASYLGDYRFLAYNDHNVDRPLVNTEAGTRLMHCFCGRDDLFDDQPTFYINLRFSLRPDPDYPFSNLSGEIYSHLSNLFVLTYYF